MGKRLTSKLTVLIIILLSIAVLHLPSLFEPYWYGDEGIYLTLGMAVRKGLVLYRDIHDNKPPLLYWTAALAGSQFWLKFILMVWHLATIAVFYRLAKLWSGKDNWIPVIAAGLLAALTMLPEGNIANGEIFMILPVIGGMLILTQISKLKTQNSEHQEFNYLLTGFLFSIGFLFKVPAVFDFAAAAIFYVFFLSKNIREAISRIFNKNIWLMVIGFFGPIILSLIYYATRGGFEPYLRSALLQNVGYLSSWKTGDNPAVGPFVVSGLTFRAIVLLIGTISLWMARLKFKLSLKTSFASLWFLYALFGALLSARPYPHYLIQPAVPAALLLVILFIDKTKIAKVVVGAQIITAIAAYLFVGFWNYSIWSYYRNFFSWATGNKTQTEYFAFFGEQVNRAYKIAEYVRRTTSPEDRIFIWGDDPYIYPLSERLPSGRYTVAYHVVDFNAYDETVAAVKFKMPKIIIWLDYGRQFSQLSAIISSDYVRAEDIGGAAIYRLVRQ
ncbi:hypothetical protein HZB78_04090 [Candidatus Collierbacteria bacterium]|nr:hypothetical protein [Candidatus Collierbacteria bacterium]